MFVNMFRIDGRNHVALSSRQRLQRGRGHRVLCAVVIGQEAVRLSAHSEPGRSAPISCDRCLSSFIGFCDLIDQASGIDREIQDSGLDF